MADETVRNKHIEKYKELVSGETLAMYEFLFKYIQCENQLVNQRTTWFITLNSFLFASIALVVSANDGGGDLVFRDVWIVSFGLVISIVGLASSFAAHKSIEAAFNAVKALKDYWVDRWEPNFLESEMSEMRPHFVTTSSKKESSASPRKAKSTNEEHPSRHDSRAILPFLKGGGPGHQTAERGRSFVLSLVKLIGGVWVLFIAFGAIWMIVRLFG